MAHFDVLVVGTLNWDVSLFVKKLPSIGEEVVVEKLESGPGGKGGNVAVAAARILGPSRVALIACLGQDEPGRRQTLTLKQEGVETSGIRIVKSEGSGQAYITVDQQGNDTILTHFGANKLLDEEQIMTSRSQTLLANSKVIVIVGSPKAAVRRVLSEARRLKKTIVWHPGVLARFGMKEWKNEVKHAQYLILNEHEARAFSGKNTLEEARIEFENESPETRLLVTLGDKGAAYYYQKKHSRVAEIDIAKLEKKTVNTTGCGDAFVGTFAAYKSIATDDEKALGYANMAGALKATRPEVRGSPTRTELEDSYTRYFDSFTK